jgi:hypothetical protein
MIPSRKILCVKDDIKEIPFIRILEPEEEKTDTTPRIKRIRLLTHNPRASSLQLKESPNNENPSTKSQQNSKME